MLSIYSDNAIDILLQSITPTEQTELRSLLAVSKSIAAAF